MCRDMFRASDRHARVWSNVLSICLCCELYFLTWYKLTLSLSMGFISLSLRQQYSDLDVSTFNYFFTLLLFLFVFQNYKRHMIKLISQQLSVQVMSVLSTNKLIETVINESIVFLSPCHCRNTMRLSHSNDLYSREDVFYPIVSLTLLPT